MCHVLRVLFLIQSKYNEVIRLNFRLFLSWGHFPVWAIFESIKFVALDHCWSVQGHLRSFQRVKNFDLPVNGYEISHKIAGTAVREKYQPQRSALPIILGSAIICLTEFIF